MQRNSGAPLGNHNAYKHGFYSAAFKAAERRLLSQIPAADLTAEIRFPLLFINSRSSLRIKIG